jgi:beta-mannosidase
LFENILPQAVAQFDGTRPYWPSSPSKGWGRPESLTEGDVHYWGVWWGEQPYEVYREKVGRFNSEYGYQSYPDYSTLLKIAEGEELSMDAKVIAAHQKHARGTRQIDDFIKRYYPNVQPKDFEEYVHLSQLSQAYGMEVAIEAHRTAKPYNMGTLYWQLNDAWPVTSWSSIDYYGNPKVLQDQLKTLFAPVLLSLDRKDCGVFVTSDLLRNIDGMLTVKVCDLEDLKVDELKDRPLFEQKVKVKLDANENRKFVVDGLREFLANADLQKVYVKLQLTEGDTLTAERKCYFSAFFE